MVDTDKIWAKKYKDTISVTQEEIDLPPPTLVDVKSAEHHPGWNAPVYYPDGDPYCYIYSDQEIGGLELVAENVKFGA